MKTRLLPALIAATALLAACQTPEQRAAQQAQHEQWRAELQRTIPRCDDRATCDAMWRAAQRWVASYAGYNMHTVTDVVIQTYSPGKYTDRFGARVTMLPAGDGSHKLIYSPVCAPYQPACVRRASESLLHFNKTVGAAG